ncbi:DUF1643 domain-containing protein [Paenibacillus sp. FSL K6-2862]|uniref:DUF1643 domain-containing protein n=1 Tax=Paenibacillus sp. FSL K6-2862 TaxID=2921484 RepID=UPI0030F5E9F0
MIKIKYPISVDLKNIRLNKKEIAKVKTCISFDDLKIDKTIESTLFTREYLEIPILNGGSKRICFCLMNPSKADTECSDKTVNIVINFVNEKRKEEAFEDIGTIVIVNLFPFYETVSSFLGAIINYFGEDQDKDLEVMLEKNQQVILERLSSSDWIVLGWGDCPDNFKKVIYDSEIKEVLKEASKMKNVYIFEDENNKGITIKKQPRHPNRLQLNSLKLVEVEISEVEIQNKSRRPEKSYEIEVKKEI